MLMPKQLESSAQLIDFLQQHPAVVVYFSGKDCGVCQVLRPRIIKMLQEEFPRLAIAEVECSAAPELAAQQLVFALPVVVVFFHGKEQLRLARNFTPDQLAATLARPYALFFA
ncbi:MAG: thioredoxin family protein [Thiohalomonadaceae bacterium]